MIEVLRHDGRQIIYRPELNRLTGSVTATILFQQILYRWAENSAQPFYKFKAPCTHAQYRAGDSWCEELGFTKAEFDGALQRLGAKVRKGDPAPDGFLVYYFTDFDRLTWYGINEAEARKALAQIYAALPAAPPAEKKAAKASRFERPAPEDLAAYMATIGGTPAHAQAFQDHFDSNGWRIGGRTPMKDWRAAARQWMRREGQFKAPARRAGEVPAETRAPREIRADELRQPAQDREAVLAGIRKFQAALKERTA